MQGAMDFFWYDYETTGRWPVEDRPVQFAGVRTDATLREMRPVETLYCQPAPDCLPKVRACLVHRISPQEARHRGVTEHEFASRIHRLLSEPNTCAVGFNAMRFDHMFTQLLFYRNMLEPYAWHYKNGNAKWDIINLFRAAYALRPEGLNWAKDENGKLSFSQEDLAEANGIQLASVHDAAADVKTMLSLARLIRKKQPKLWDYYLGLCKKAAVSAQLQDTFIYISGSVLHWRRSGTVAAILGSDDSGSVYAFDLSYDPRICFDTEDKALLAKGSTSKKAVHRFRANASPFVVRFDISAPLSAKGRAELTQMGLDLETLQRHYTILEKNRSSYYQRVTDAFETRWADNNDVDVDVALFSGGFIPNVDRRQLERILASTDAPARWEHFKFRDRRLPELVFRFRARNFPESLSREDAARWRAHCRYQVFQKQDSNGLTPFDHYKNDIEEKRREDIDEDTRRLLDDLESYGDELKAKLTD